MIYPLRYYGDPILRKVAHQVTKFDEELKTLAADMLETMYDANGVGLAAPQIGLSARIFVAVQQEPVEEVEDESDMAAASTPAEKRRRWGVVAEHVLVNPEITTQAGEQYGQDGCLSVPGLFVEELPRDFEITVRYQDLHGNSQELTAEGRFAHVLQHELDHLDGILFFDRLPAKEKQTFLDANRAELAEMQRQAKAFLKELKAHPAQAGAR
jgi:peptide deformylase